MSNEFDFWYSIGSTYTYLSVMRVTNVCNANGVSVRWRPFNVRKIISEIGNRPFSGKPKKMSYMWRDIKRRSEMYGIPASLPAPYPIAELDLANRVAILGQQEGWHVQYTQETYRKWFQLGIEPGVEPQLSETLREIGQDPSKIIERANGDAIAEAYEEATEIARKTGLFGSPCFVVGEELFWGDDRLEDAISWCLHGAVRRV